MMMVNNIINNEEEELKSPTYLKDIMTKWMTKRKPHLPPQCVKDNDKHQ
jgi:hypothetical protein